MFGFSPVKILVLAAIVVGVWYGFKWLSRRGQMIDRGKSGDAPPQVEDMVRCEKCGVFYTPADGHNCAA